MKRIEKASCSLVLGVFFAIQGIAVGQDQKDAGLEAGKIGDVSTRGVLPLSVEERAALAKIVAESPEAAALYERKLREARQLQGVQPDPIAVIQYEGLVHTDPRRIATVEHLEDMDRAALLLEAWQVNGDPDLARQARRYVLAWAETYEPTGNDVNENKLYPLMVIHEAMRADFEPEEQEKIDAWLTDLARRQLEQGRNPNARRSNRHTKRLRIVATIGLALDRQEWLDLAWADFEVFVEHQLYPDGKSFDLEHRDTLTYHTSALRPLVDLAVLAARDGRDLYSWTSPTGSSLKKSVDYVVPYADGTKRRREWINSKVGLDHRRAEAGLEEYRPGRYFDPKYARRILEESAYFDPGLMPLVIRLAESDAEQYPTWRTVLNDACRMAAER
ncbi:hypothetical protein BH23PLA1_BH23PLA1_38760 [soil metagenome]